jgi:tRNA threonylcarbamoyladenosine modification (KEOPS) complex  Pcc1 subunit
MRLKARLVLEYGSEEEAKAVAEALRPDNEGFVQAEVAGKSIEATVNSDTASSLRHTLDDFLACVKVAEEAVGIERAGPAEEE